jgi:phospholipid/cholesterol/gamma-HCH transport system substrate-binding protein
MIIQFGGRLALPFQGERLVVEFEADRSDGINVGSGIRYLGVPVGTVTEVKPDFDRLRVVIVAEIQKDRELPANLEGFIRLPNILGAGAIIEMRLLDPMPAPERLAEGAVLKARYVGSELIPVEVVKAFDEIRSTFRSVNDEEVISRVRATIDNLDGRITQAGNVIAGLEKIAGDEQVVADVRTAIANLKAASERAVSVVERADRIAAGLESLPEQAQATVTDLRAGVAEAREAVGSATVRIDEVAGKISANLDQVSAALENARSITAKIDAGEGTAGKLVNDPRLYETLIHATELLNATMADIQRLTQQIEQEGFKLRL